MPIEFHRDGPWELPEGWVWARLGDLCDFVGRGRGPSYVEEGGVPVVNQKCIRWRKFEDRFLRQTARIAFERLPQHLRLQSGDVLWNSTGTGTIGRAVVYDGHLGDVTVDSHITVVRSRLIDPHFVCSYIETIRVQHLVADEHVGSTNQQELPRTFIQELLIPVPPVAEQRRIVARIDELFTEIADGEAMLAYARDDLDTWRRALLKEAVTGELTRDWRDVHHHRESSVEYVQRLSCALNKNKSLKVAAAQVDHFDQVQLPESWTRAEIETIFRVATGATPKRGNPRYYNGGTFPWVTSSVVNEPIVLAANQFITKAAIEETNAKVFPPGTILVAMYGEGKTRGKATELGIAAATNQACAALLQPEGDSMFRSYVKYWFEYNYLELRKQAAGGVQPNLNLEIIKRLRIPIPPPDEMAAIVSQLSDEFGDAAATLHELRGAGKAATGLRQSLLKAAFQGRLVGQEPNDEPADRLFARLSELDDTAVRPRRGAALAAE